MKTLLAMRHAKSSWESDLNDHDRPLNERGRADAPSLGAALQEHDLIPQLILTSTAKRARRTAELVAENCSFDGEILLRPDFYEASLQDYLEGIRGVPPAIATLLIVGHNPGMTELVEDLTGRPEALGTGNIAVITFEIEAWAELDGETDGRLVKVFRPREL